MTDHPFNAQITFLYTRDLKSASRFYERILGCSLALDQGSCRIYRTVDVGAYVGICQSDDAPVHNAGLILTLVTPEVDAWHQRIVESGWPCEHPPRYNEYYKIYHFFLRDPSGNRIEIQRFDSEDWGRL